MTTLFLSTIQRLSNPLIDSFDAFLMSSTPHSPPDTPLKPTMAVDKENVTPKARSFEGLSRTGIKESTAETPSNNVQEPKAPSFEVPSRNGIQEPAAETPSKGVQQPKNCPEVQVPSTLPHNDNEDGPLKTSVPETDLVHANASDIPTEDAADDRRAETDTAPVSCPDQPLQQMDWNDFESRYRDTMQKANDEEDALLAEFDKYVEVSQSFLSLFPILMNYKGFLSLGYSSSST